MIKCLHCGAETSNGLALCALCQRKVISCLEFLPLYFRNLARWRPGRAGSRPVPGSRMPAGVLGSVAVDRVSDALDEAANMLTTRAREFADDRPHLARLLDRLVAADLTEQQNVAWLCKGFERYLASLSTLGWCGDFVTDLDYHETILRGLTETVAPGWYAGGCQHCGSGTYVVPGLTWVTCLGCGTTTYARDHLDVVLDEARPWVAGPKSIAQAIVALLDTEESVPRLHDRIRQWGARDKITSIRRVVRDHVYDDELDRIVLAEVEVGAARYRLGEVLDMVLTEGATRSAASATSAVG